MSETSQSDRRCNRQPMALRLVGVLKTCFMVLDGDDDGGCRMGIEIVVLRIEMEKWDWERRMARMT